MTYSTVGSAQADLSTYVNRFRHLQDKSGAAIAGLQAVKLARLDALMMRIVESAFDAVITASAEGFVQTANKSACETFGFRHNQLLGRAIADFIPDFDELVNEDSSRFAIGEGHTETIALRAGQTAFPLDLCIARTIIGSETVYVVVARDITALREQQAKLEHQALHDSLTGLPNRLLLNDRIQSAVSKARRESQLVALMMMDLDRFKQVNDTLGHHVGDLLLKELATRLQHPIRESDTVARLGGDEFAVLLPAVDSVEHAVELAERLRQVFLQPFEVQEGVQIDVGCSVGIAMFPDHSKDPSRLLQCADVAMYAAKTGAEKVVVYDPSKDGNTVRRLTLSSELRQAIGGGELTMEFQPKYDLVKDQVASVEALCRWNHPRLGAVPPDEFILHAEQTGMIPDLTRWTFEASLAQLARWRAAGYDLSMAINLSARMLHDEAIPALVEGLARSYRLPPDRITIEITESAISLDPKTAKRNARRLSDAGFKLSIDDFGTGYSSLSYLQSMPLDEIKIDRSFVINMLMNNSSAVIVRSTIDLAHNLGLTVVAEGVESREHFAALKELSADFIQGYYISSSMTSDDLLKWLKGKPAAMLRDDSDVRESA